MNEKKTYKQRKGVQVRKDFNIDVDIAKLSKFVKCNPKGVYYIENNIYNAKPIRYLMYMRKNGLNVNKLIDQLIANNKTQNSDDEY